MSIEIQRQMLDEIKEEIETLDRILNEDYEKVDEDLMWNLYKLLVK